MERSSSTSSSSRRLLGWGVLTGLLLLLPWVIDLGFGESLSEAVASRIGSRLDRLSKGVIPDNTAFVRVRIRDVAWLSTTAFLMIVGGELFRRLIRPRVSPLFLWVPLSIYVLIAVNLFLLVASQSVVFWGTLFAAQPTLKQSGFHLRRTLLAESQASRRGVVIGSSQGGSEIDDGQLNASFYPQIQFSNLSYAGSGGFDFLLLQGSYLPLRPHVVVAYLNELTLYGRPGTGRYIPLLTPQSVRDLAALDRERAFEADVGFGLAAYCVPAFRLRRALEVAVFGAEVGDLRSRIKAKAAQTVDESAVAAANGYTLSGNTTFQKQSLRLFLERNQQAGITTVLVIGQLSPRVEKHLAPEVVADFQAYVKSLSDTPPPNVVVLSDLPRHDESDYPSGDFMHVFASSRKVFTAALIKRLQSILDLTAS